MSVRARFDGIRNVLGGAPAIPFRIAIILLAVAVYILALKSSTLSSVIGRSLAAPLHFGPEPGWLLAAFGVALGWAALRMRDVARWPDRQQVAIAGIVLVVIVGATVLVTHPSDAWRAYLGPPPDTDQTPQSAAVGALRYLLILVAIGPIAAMLFPLQYLRSKRGTLLCVTFLLVSYLGLGVLRVLLNPVLAPPIIGAVAAVLAPFCSSVSVFPSGTELSCDGFRVVVGPPCLGLDLLALFIVFFAFVWFQLGQNRRCSQRRAAVALLGGIAAVTAINLLRIAVIMLIGARRPEYAVELLHSVAGGVLLGCLLLVYARLVVPWMVQSKSPGIVSHTMEGR